MIRGKIRFDSIYVRERSDAVGFAVPRVEEVAGRPLKYSMFVLVDILFRRWMKWMDPSNQARFALIGQVHLEYCSGTVCHSDCSGSRHWRSSLWCTLLGKSFQTLLSMSLIVRYIQVLDCERFTLTWILVLVLEYAFLLYIDNSTLSWRFPMFWSFNTSLSYIPKDGIVLWSFTAHCQILSRRCFALISFALGFLFCSSHIIVLTSSLWWYFRSSFS
jgi:hypothetical protein